MSDGDFRRPPLLWEQRLAQRVDVSTVGLGVSATYEVSNEPPPGEGGPGTDPPVETPRPDDFTKPSTPTLTGAVQGIRATWNGLTASGNPFPIETAWIEVHLSTAGTGFTPGTATLKGQLYDPGEFFLGGLTAGTTYYVKLRGADAAGSVTDASDAASGQTGLTTAGDYGTATIGSGAVSFDARTIGGVTNTVGSVEPTSPLNGDVWLDSSPGTAIIHKIYSGGSWTTNAWGSASIAAGQITALQIAAGAVTAGAISAGAVTAAKIDADAINGKTIVGATVKTAGTVGPSGYPGVVIDTSGLKAYNSTGGTTVNINAATGNVTISGYLTQADVGSGGSTNIDGGRITTGTISATRLDLSGVLTATSVGSGGTTQIDGGRITTGTISADRISASILRSTDVGSGGSTVIDGGRITSGTITGRTIRTSGGGSRIVLADGGADKISFFTAGSELYYTTHDDTRLTFVASGAREIRVDGKLWVTSPTTVNGLASADDITTTQDLEVAGAATIDTSAALGQKTVSGVVQKAFRVSSAGEVFSFGIDESTTASAANVRVGASAQLLRSTSTVRVKDQVVSLGPDLLGVDAEKLADFPASIDPSDVLDISPTEFRSLCNTDGSARHFGFIAEDVAEKFPFAAEWEDDGTARSVQDRPIIAALLYVAQQQQAAIDDLTARIEALEA